MKSAKLFASQGGPIILSQIENEYGNVERGFQQKGFSYVRWAAQMAVGLQTGVPWVMCKQDDAPDPVINTCNGMQCGKTFNGPNSPNKPSLWTENWTSFYQFFGGVPYLRSASDIAYNVALFIIAKKGSYVNYYMYHGGTNFDRLASPFITTAYYDEAPLDEYGLVRQPKWGHLKELHAAIKSCSQPLLYGTQTTFNLGLQQKAYVFRSSTECAAFLENSGPRDVTIKFLNIPYQLTRKSISILPGCKNVAFNTGKVTIQNSIREMKPQFRFNSAEKWKVYTEAIPNFDDTSLRANRLLDQIATAKDTSDYMWYTFRLNHNSPNAQSVLSSAHGSHNYTSVAMEKNVNLVNGMNNISILSATVGLPNSGAYLERKVAGLSKVKVQRRDFTNYSWGYQTTFDAPEGNKPVVLNLGSMGKGLAWVNGQGIGRYWVSFHTPRGTPSQQWYHIPRSFLKATGNLLVILEEETGNPLGITLDTVYITN
ncbi:beta-galactosidase 16-like protein [Trifolium pratense]|nr:beta-galactosidase 16-like protein [Trifolium pratense]PNX95036.1 beta-galactosidase 16-like protein [Trifolium pratense]